MGVQLPLPAPFYTPYPIYSQMLTAFDNTTLLCPPGWLAEQGTNLGTVRIHLRFKGLHSITAASTPVDSPGFRQITGCAADLSKLRPIGKPTA